MTDWDIDSSQEPVYLMDESDATISPIDDLPLVPDPAYIPDECWKETEDDASKPLDSYQEGGVDEVGKQVTEQTPVTQAHSPNATSGDTPAMFPALRSFPLNPPPSPIVRNPQATSPRRVYRRVIRPTRTPEETIAALQEELNVMEEELSAEERETQSLTEQLRTSRYRMVLAEMENIKLKEQRHSVFEALTDICANTLDHAQYLIQSVKTELFLLPESDMGDRL